MHDLNDFNALKVSYGFRVLLLVEEPERGRRALRSLLQKMLDNFMDMNMLTITFQYGLQSRGSRFKLNYHSHP